MDIFCGLLMFMFIGFIIAIIVTIFGYILAIITYPILRVTIFISDKIDDLFRK